MIQAPLTSIEDIIRFILAGNAKFTIRSKKTGTRFTYRVRRPRSHKPDSTFRFVDVLTGSDNESSYTYLGQFKDNKYIKGMKSRISDDAPSATAMRFLADCMTSHHLSKHLEVWHEGVCGACGRTLTVPKSIKTGFGPDCAERLGIICEDLDDEEEMKLWEVIGDREGTVREEEAKHEARRAMESR